MTPAELSPYRRPSMPKPKAVAKATRVKPLHILLTEEEFAILRKVARAAGLSMSAYGRQAILERAAGRVR